MSDRGSPVDVSAPAVNTEIWNKEWLAQLISDKVEEHLGLEYKAGDALDGSDKRKLEITKDVAAFANAAGGVLIYGISEAQNNQGLRIPVDFSPVDATGFSKERLEQIIATIRPKVESVKITTIPITEGNVCYVVEIPQSGTAHQSRDFRYYKRRNFVVEMMEDYEIRDILLRKKHPRIETDFSLSNDGGIGTFNVSLANYGDVVAHHVSLVIMFPQTLVLDSEFRPTKFTLFSHEGQTYSKGIIRNLHRDLLGIETRGSTPVPYYSTRYDPILPAMQFTSSFRLLIPFASVQKLDGQISWGLNADDAPPKTGVCRFVDLKVTPFDNL